MATFKQGCILKVFMWECSGKGKPGCPTSTFQYISVWIPSSYVLLVLNMPCFLFCQVVNNEVDGDLLGTSTLVDLRVIFVSSSIVVLYHISNLLLILVSVNSLQSTRARAELLASLVFICSADISLLTDNLAGH